MRCRLQRVSARGRRKLSYARRDTASLEEVVIPLLELFLSLSSSGYTAA